MRQASIALTWAWGFTILPVIDRLGQFGGSVVALRRVWMALAPGPRFPAVEQTGEPRSIEAINSPRRVFPFKPFKKIGT